MKFDEGRLVELIHNSKTILLCAHKQPDGDALGSMLAMNRMLRQMGKETTMVSQDTLPDKYQYLASQEEILKSEDCKTGFDLAISVDVPDVGRLGACTELFFSASNTVQLDHHATNTYFADINMVDENACAAAIVVMRLMDALQYVPDEKAAECLYTALSTDTGNFCFGNVNAETFMRMSSLMETGFSLTQTAKHLHLMRSPEHMLLLGRALHSLHFMSGGKIAGMAIRQSDFQECNASLEDADQIVNHGLYITGVEMAYLATERADGVKFSLRCIDPHTVSDVAAVFGGGGHRLASGCFVAGDFDQAVEQMNQAMLKGVIG